MKKKELKKHIKELQEKLNLANKTVKLQIDQIENLYIKIDAQKNFIGTLEGHIEIAEKAIERKDKQFLGLRSAYQDEIINKG